MSETLSHTFSHLSDHNPPSNFTSLSGLNRTASHKRYSQTHSQKIGSGSERFPTNLGSILPSEDGRTRSKIFGEFASKDYNVMKSNIILFPLCFINSYDEAKFYTRILQSFHIRARLAAIASFIMYSLYWIIVAVCLSFHTFPSSGTSAQVAFSVAMFIVTLSSWIPYVASSYSLFRKYTEVSIYIVVILVRIGKPSNG